MADSSDDRFARLLKFPDWVVEGVVVHKAFKGNGSPKRVSVHIRERALADDSEIPLYAENSAHNGAVPGVCELRRDDFSKAEVGLSFADDSVTDPKYGHLHYETSADLTKAQRERLAVAATLLLDYKPPPAAR